MAHLYRDDYVSQRACTEEKSASQTLNWPKVVEQISDFDDFFDRIDRHDEIYHLRHNLLSRPANTGPSGVRGEPLVSSNFERTFTPRG